MFTYLFGGAIAGSTARYLQFLLPGTLVMTVLLLTIYTGVGLSTDSRQRHASTASGRCRSGGRRRSSARSSATSAATSSRRRSSSASAWRWASAPTAGAAGVLGGAGADPRVRVRPVVGLDDARPARPHAERRHEPRPGRAVPAHAREQRLRRPERRRPGWLQAVIHANPVTHLVTAVRGLMHGARGRRRHRVGARHLRRARRGVRAADDAPLRPSGSAPAAGRSGPGSPRRARRRPSTLSGLTRWTSGVSVPTSWRSAVTASASPRIVSTSSSRRHDARLRRALFIASGTWSPRPATLGPPVPSQRPGNTRDASTRVDNLRVASIRERALRYHAPRHFELHPRSAVPGQSIDRVRCPVCGVP